MLKDHVLNRLMNGRCPTKSLQLRPKFHSLFLHNQFRMQYETLIAEACDFFHNSIPRKLPIGNSTGYFTRYIEIVREICNSTARVK